MRKNQFLRNMTSVILAAAMTMSSMTPAFPAETVSCQASAQETELQDDSKSGNLFLSGSDSEDQNSPEAETASSGCTKEEAGTENTVQGTGVTEEMSEAVKAPDPAEDSESGENSESEVLLTPENLSESDKVSESEEAERTSELEAVSDSETEIRTEGTAETDCGFAGNTEGSLESDETEPVYNFIQYLMTDGGYLNVYYTEEDTEVLTPIDFSGDYDVEVNLPCGMEISYTAVAYDGYAIESVTIADEDGNILEFIEGAGESTLMFTASSVPEYKTVISIAFEEKEMPEDGRLIRYTGTGTASISVYTDEERTELAGILEESTEELDVSQYGFTLYLDIVGDEETGSVPYEIIQYVDGVEISEDLIYSDVDALFHAYESVEFRGEGYEVAEVNIRTASEMAGVPELTGDNCYPIYDKKVEDGLQTDITKMYTNPEVGDVYQTRAIVTSWMSPSHYFYQDAPLKVQLLSTSDNSAYVADLLNQWTYSLYACASATGKHNPQHGQYGNLYFIITDVNPSTCTVSYELYFHNDNSLSYQHAYKGYGTYKYQQVGLEIIKQWKNPSSMDDLDTDVYDLTATFTIYSNAACTKKVKTVTTDALTGHASVTDLDPGTYYIKETTEPSLAQTPDDTADVITIKSGETYTYKKKNAPVRVRLTVKKVSSVDSKYYDSMKGAVYGIFAKKSYAEAAEDENDENILATVTITGEKTTLTGSYFQVGKTYYMKELKAPDSGEWMLSDTVKSFKVSEDDVSSSDKTDVCFDLTITVKEDEPKPVKIRIHKKITEGSGVNEDDSEDEGYRTWLNDIEAFTLKGAQFTFWWSQADAENLNMDTAVCTVTVKAADEDGEFYSAYKSLSGITLGETKTIYYRETKAPYGFALNPAIHSKAITFENANTVEYYTCNVSNIPTYLRLAAYVYKVADDGSDTPLEGATIKVTYYPYAQGSDAVYIWYFKTGTDGKLLTDLDANGNPQALEGSSYIYYTTAGRAYFPEGYYEIQETKAPEGYVCDNTVYHGLTAHIENSSTLAEARKLYLYDADTSNTGIVIKNEPEPGYMKLKKISSNTTLTDQNALYSLAGAEYSVYTNAECTASALEMNTRKTAVLITDENGDTNTLTLSRGTYYVKETKASPGYEMDTTVYTVEVSPLKTATFTSKEIPIYYSADLILKKVTDYATTLSLEDAVFRFEFYAGAKAEGEKPTVTWYFESDADGKIKFEKNYLASAYSSGNLYYDSANNVCLPLGFLKITEEKAPTGFNASTDTVTYTLTGSGYTIQKSGTESAEASGSLTSSAGLNAISQAAVETAGIINDVPVFGGVSLDKKDLESVDGNAQGDGDLAGFTFDVISLNDYMVSLKGDRTKNYSKNEIVMTLTTDENGHAESGTVLQYGTYKIVESGQGTGYTSAGSNTIFPISISKQDEVVEYEVKNLIMQGGVSIKKTDFMLERSAAHGDATLGGAVFMIVNASASTVVNAGGKEIPSSGLTGTPTYEEVLAAASSSVVQTIMTSPDGSAATEAYDLPYGIYYMIETKPAEGYFLNTEWVGKAVIREDGIICAAETIRAQHSGEETIVQQIFRSGIHLKKTDLETRKDSGQGYANFENAEFAIINASDAVVVNSDGNEIPTAKDQIGGKPDYNTLRKLADDGTYTVQKMTTNAEGTWKTGNNALPYGTYYVIETQASYGYWIDENFIGLVVIREDGESIALGETSKSGKSYFVDINDRSSALASSVDQLIRRSDLQFLKVTIDGEYKPYIPFLISAIALDADGKERVLESHVFVSDANGRVDTSRTHSVNTNGFDRYVENGVVTGEGEAYLKEAASWGIWFGSLDAVNDKYGALYPCYYRITEIQCEANASLSENLLESDLLYIYNDSGELTEVMSDNAQYVYYHPLVDTEILLESKAVDTESGTQTLPARESVEVSDSVSYTHVSADHRYRLETQFVDLTAGNTVLSVIGTNDETAKVSDDSLWVTKEFEPEKKSGTNNTWGEISVSALLNTKSLNGHTIVAVDYLYQYINGCWILVAIHDDYTDTDQMLYIPDLVTSALDGLTGSRVGARSEKDFILDSVSYSNLAKGEMYVITMQVADPFTGELTESGKTVYSKRIYSRTATPVSGVVEMPAFSIDSSDFESEKTLVVIEALYRSDEDGNPVGEPILVHESFVDEDQTIRYPEVCTSARDAATCDEVGASSDTTALYDEVTIMNVIFDENDLDGQYSYRVKGRLVYQQDFTDMNGITHKAGEPVETLEGTMNDVTITSDATGNATLVYADGSAAKGTVTITGYGQNRTKSIIEEHVADNSYQTDNTAAIATVTVEMIYTVKSSALEGGTVVVYEDLYHNDTLVDSHADLTDKRQSVHFPKVATSAKMDATGDTVGSVQENAVITDTVSLINLVPGRTYMVSGILMDSMTGEPFLVNGCEISQQAEIRVTEDGEIITDGKEQVSVTGFSEKYNTVDGTIDLVFMFDATGFAGSTVVVFEELLYNEVTVASHRDLEDENQTVHFPEIHTAAADGYTKDAIGTVSGKASIVDTVTYTNLVPGKEYRVSGILMNKKSGGELLDADGNTIMAARSFIAGQLEDGITGEVNEKTNSVSGTIEIEFLFDGSLLEDVTTVVYEDLSHNDTIVTTHRDLSDKEQTVYYPKIRTSAIDGTVGDEVGMTGTTTIVDTVSLWNLVPGYTYTVSGSLMNKENGESVQRNGEAIAQKAVLTVNEDGTVITEDGEDITEAEYDEKTGSVCCKIALIFPFDASDLAGVTTVVFEELQHASVTVASHTDITDLGQSVHFPEIHTTAKDGDTGSPTGTVEEDAVIEDTVAFSNLVVGKEYMLTGLLMNRESGLPVLNGDGNEITSTVTFTASKESCGDMTVTAYHEENQSIDGTYLVTFALDSRQLAGETVIVFESLYHNENEVTTHADLSDNGQSIYYPDIHTTATDSSTKDHVGGILGAVINFARSVLGYEVMNDEKQVITDKVALTNLAPGMTYILSGKLYNVTESLAAGEEKPLIIDGEEITQSVTFTVSEDGTSITAVDGAATSVTAYHKELHSVDGTIELLYTLDSSKIQGEKLVVFEKLYQDVSYMPDTKPDTADEEDLVNEHSDLEDEEQSVSELSISTTAVDAATGDHVGSVPINGNLSAIRDEVNLAGLVEGMEYTINGVLVSLDESDLASGNFYYLKEDGSLCTERSEAYTETLTFTAEEASQVQYLNFALNSDKIQGRTLTVFETIWHEDVLISSHPAGENSNGNGWDMDSLVNQTVYYPAAKTNASDSSTGKHMASAEENCTIVDRVYFENLLTGQTYTIYGQMVYQKSFTDADGLIHKAGEAVTDMISVSFTAAENLAGAAYEDGSGTAAVDSLSVTEYPDGQKTVSGYVSLSFSVDASKLAGATLVAFESISHNGAEIIVHNDLNDLPQTIKIPKISTNASVLDLDEASVFDSEGNYIDITITDMVSYRNLWTAEEIVRLSAQAKQVNYEDGSSCTESGELYSITEKAVYILKGILMDKSTGEPLRDNSGRIYEIYSKAFTPESENGMQEVTFIVNGADFIDENGGTALAGKSLVVFEDLYLCSSKKNTSDTNHVAEHHDIDDMDQDIRFPNGRTHATAGEDTQTANKIKADSQATHEAEENSRTAHEMEVSSTMTITDLFTYENLHGGTVYTVKGVLQAVTEVDENGVPVKWEQAIDDSGNAIISTATFDTSEISTDYNDSVSGSVRMTFHFEGTSLAGKTLVAFEEISRNGISVLIHADITDDAQTVHISESQPSETEESTEEKAVQTGDPFGWRPLGTAVIMAIALIVIGEDWRRIKKRF
ncbi:MAG: VaFE repeat-containing surface-anchored protein [Clostridiales bacterium]|nr:VaFE repeat-containing surface-anchored protein [Clostridiales bacterium]